MTDVRESLKTPPKLAKDALRVIPLGGLGDVGRNSTSFEFNGQLLLVDCGVLFPSDDHPGVDLILPGLHLLEERFDDIQALVLTHGHEDHIGAVPYLLRSRPDIPVIGSRLTLALVREKLRKRRLRDVDLRVVYTEAPGSRSASSTSSSSPSTTPHPGRAGGRDPDARGPRPAHRRLQDGPAAAGPPSHRPARLRAAREEGDRPVHGRLHQRRDPGFTHERDIEPAMERVFSSAKQKLDRGLLRLACAPRPTGAGRRRAAHSLESSTSVGRWFAI